MQSNPPAQQYFPIEQNDWFVDERIWSPVDSNYNQTHGGVIRDNVVRDANGDVVIFANGSYYEGPKRGINFDGLGYPNQYGGRRTGGLIQSKNTYGPGSFEVLMKVPSASGICSSMWLFNAFEGHNYEIDIELHGTAVDGSGNRINPQTPTNLSSILCSTWVTELDVVNRDAPTGKPLADGQFHKFRFDWHTGSDPRVEYYVDGVLVMTIRDYIPTNEMYLNIGCWFPRDWCGQPDFETDAMVIRSFTYTPFTNETATRENCATKSGYAITTGAVEQINLLTNGSFNLNRQDVVWTVDGSFANGVLNGKVWQTLNMDAENVNYLLTLTGSGSVTVTVKYGSIVNGVTVTGSDTFELTLGANGQARFTPPAGCTTFTIEISSISGATLVSAVLSV